MFSCSCGSLDEEGAERAYSAVKRDFPVGVKSFAVVLPLCVLLNDLTGSRDKSSSSYGRHGLSIDIVPSEKVNEPLIPHLLFS